MAARRKEEALRRLKETLQHLHNLIEQTRRQIKALYEDYNRYTALYRQTQRSIYRTLAEGVWKRIKTLEDKVKELNRRQHETITRMLELTGTRKIWFVKDRILYGETLRKEMERRLKGAANRQIERGLAAEPNLKDEAKESLDQAEGGWKDVEAQIKGRLAELFKGLGTGLGQAGKTVKGTVEGLFKTVGGAVGALQTFALVVTTPLITFFKSVLLPDTETILAQFGELEEAFRRKARERVGLG